VKILITGATGFVGGALLKQLGQMPGYHIVALARRPIGDIPHNTTVVISDDFSVPDDDYPLLKGLDVVVHCGARAHQMHDNPETCLEEYRRVNVTGTLMLAKQAAEAKVKRFVYLSSIKVNGEMTEAGKSFTAEDTPAPADPYGVSKMEAELELQRFASSVGMELVIIRPVLVYGPGVRANFLTLMSLISKGIPLPFARVNNKRSFLYVGNLVEFIKVCMTHRAARNNIFLISDGEDLSTPSLIVKISKAFGRAAILLPVPVSLMVFCAAVLGKRAITTRLCSSLQVDLQKNSNLLDWKPPFSADQGIESTAKAFLEAERA